MADSESCVHYVRRCLIVAPCCDTSFACHHCHNAHHKDAASGEIAHEIDRFAISEVVCCACGVRQPKSARCAQCSESFGDYACLKCAIWACGKDIYHCDGCAICRVGKREDYFHCDKCSACLSSERLNNHKCLEGAMKNKCPICLEEMFDSIEACIMMPQCGHMIHQSCYRTHLVYNPRAADSCILCRAPTQDEPDEDEEELLPLSAQSEDDESYEFDSGPSADEDLDGEEDEEEAEDDEDDDVDDENEHYFDPRPPDELEIDETGGDAGEDLVSESDYYSNSNSDYDYWDGDMCPLSCNGLDLRSDGS